LPGGLGVAEPAALFSRLELRSRAGADAAGEGAAAGGAVRGLEALAADELLAPAIADVPRAGRVEPRAADAGPGGRSGGEFLIVATTTVVASGQQRNYHAPQDEGADDAMNERLRGHDELC